MVLIILALDLWPDKGGDAPVQGRRIANFTAGTQVEYKLTQEDLRKTTADGDLIACAPVPDEDSFLAQLARSD
ncbi:unnamed protein product [Caretta caretta]